MGHLFWIDGLESGLAIEFADLRVELFDFFRAPIHLTLERRANPLLPDAGHLQVCDLNVHLVRGRLPL